MSINSNSNTSIIIQHLTSQPNDLFSSLKIKNILDFIEKIKKELSSKVPNKNNIKFAGFTILKELIIEKINKKILSIPNDSEKQKLIQRIEYFENEFEDNFISDLPLSTNTNPIIKTGYNSFYKELFKLQNTKIRQLLEKTSPNTQCSNIIDAQNKHSICYLCGCEFDNSRSGKRKKKTHASLQCEHILPIFPAITHIMLYQKRYNPTSELQEFLNIEYAWSHMCCNLLKNDLDFTLYNSSTKKYEINQESINEFEKLLNNKTKNHNDDKEHKISTDCKTIKENWCSDGQFPNKKKQKLKSKITNILEKINKNFDEIKNLTDPEIAHEYYILLMKYKMIAALTQNTMEEILFFGNEKLLNAVQNLKKDRKQINDKYKEPLQKVASDIKTIEEIIEKNGRDLKDLKRLQTSARLSSERILQLVELGGEDAVKTNLTANKATLEILKAQKNQIVNEKEQKINEINEDIKKLTGTNEEDEEDEEDEENEQDEEVAAGKKKKKTKKKRKAGRAIISSNFSRNKRKAGRAIISSNFSRNKRKFHPYKSVKSVKSVKPVKSVNSVKSVKLVKSTSIAFNYNYNKFILSLLLNKSYQPSVREIKQIIKNKFA
tara:strand:- start:249 stop:2063 length:1815 start_codon:yes stop_codon:yes gene_type:complete